MNKDKLKLRLLLTSCCFIITFFVACQFDDSVETKQKLETTNQHFKLERIKLDKFSKNSKLINQLSKIASNKNSNKLGKTVLASDGSFTINTEFATYIESDNGKHSYTFKINRNNPEYLLENLVLSSNDSLGYVAYIAQYDINEHEYQMLIDNSSFNVSEKIILSKLNDNKIISTIFSKESIEIQTMCLNSVTQCEFGLHWGFNGGSGNLGECDVPHTFTTFYNWVECTETIEIVGGGGPGGDGSSGGGSGDSTDSTYDGSDTNIHGNGGVTTAPTLEEDEEIITPQDLCNDLASKDANPDFINYMADLKTRAANQNFESAYTMFQNASLGLQFSPRYDGSLQEPEVNIGIGFTDTSADLNSVGAIHCHLDDGTTFKIFSFSDIIALAEFADISTRPTSEFGIYVVTSSGTFCLKIKNKIQLKQMLTRMQMTLKTYEDDFDKYVKKEQGLDTQVLKFLKFLKIKQFGNVLELYKKNETNNVWQKQELNSNESAVNPTNC
jgi:hypothetical protein